MRWLVCLVLISLIGCHKGRYDQSAMARLPEKERKIVGQYELEKSHESISDPEMQKLADMFAGYEGITTLECFPDKRFEMTSGNVPMKGTWEMAGAEVHLSVQEVNGKKASEIGKVKDTSRGISGFDLSTPDRNEFLNDFMNSMALERAQSLSVLKVGIDGTSLYTTAAGPGSLFGSKVSTFRRKSGAE
jgi:hypothetical protein